MSVAFLTEGIELANRRRQSVKDSHRVIYMMSGRILAFSDIHNDIHALRTIIQEPAEIYICAGDLTFAERGIETIAKILDPIKDRLVIVPGNNERPETIERIFPLSVHLRAVEIAGLRIGGIGGSPRTPFNTLHEWEEEWAKERLEELGPVDILVSHAPPNRTELSRTRAGIHAGSEAVRWYIERYQPELAIVGHVHEAAGKWIRMGKTLVVNPGPRGKLILRGKAQGNGQPVHPLPLDLGDQTV